MEMSEELKEQIFRVEKIMQTNRKNRELFYLFLDFDGVINVFYEPGSEKYEEMMNLDKFDFADRDCVERLNRLCLDYPIRVILSSSWRFAGVESCRSYLQNAGMKEHVEVADRTQTEVFQPREVDILQYIEEHPNCSGYIVFDDGSMPHIPEHMVQTDCFAGWDETKDRYARKLLNRQKAAAVAV